MLLQQENKIRYTKYLRQLCFFDLPHLTLRDTITVEQYLMRPDTCFSLPNPIAIEVKKCFLYDWYIISEILSFNVKITHLHHLLQFYNNLRARFLYRTCGYVS